MLKKIILISVAFVFLTAGFAIADPPGQDKGPPGYYQHDVTGEIKYFKNGHPGEPSQWTLVQPYEPPCHGSCDDAVALAEDGIMIVNPDIVYDIEEMGFGTAGSKWLKMEGEALATGKDKRIWFFKIPGFAWADVDLDMMISVCTLVFSNGEQLEGGLSFTAVKSIGILDFEGNAIAIGNNGCPQFASVKLKGLFSATAGGYAYSETANGYSYTHGEGTTTVFVTAYDSDFDKYGWFIFPPTAHAKIDGKVIVKQGGFFTAYVSPDGLTSYNFGIVTGGSAMAFGDADIHKIKAKGTVSQEALVSGYGAVAYGSSTASFNGAKGYVYSTRCFDYANVGGYAVVTGYNNITHNGNNISITSHQTAKASTQNSGWIDRPSITID